MKLLSRIPRSSAAMLVALALTLGGLFKLSAFGREAFIMWRFGLSSVTDAYFALQQLPVTAAAFMFGPFARAFTPAYAEANAQGGRVGWLPGLILYSTLIGFGFTALSLLLAGPILGAFTRSGSVATLAYLAVCYVPIMFIGFRSATWTSYGRNLSSLTLTGLPYVVMTVALVGMYLVGAMGNLSLATSMSIGFWAVGAVSAISLMMAEKPFQRPSQPFRPWKFDGFRRFTKQLTASSIETAGYSVNQFLMLYFMARAGTGAISANNCATRIGMLGYSLFAQPMVLLVQARLCRSARAEQERVARRYVSSTAVGCAVFALVLFAVRRQLVTLVYFRGNFSSAALEAVVAILPAWLCYFVVLCLNTIISQYMFHAGIGYRYTRNMLAGYTGTNILRFATAQAMGAPWIIWCGVIAEGGAFVANVLTSVMSTHWAPAPVEVAYEEV